MTVLAAKLAAALLAGRERTSVGVARKLLLARTLLRVETVGLLRHAYKEKREKRLIVRLSAVPFQTVGSSS